MSHDYSWEYETTYALLDSDESAASMHPAATTGLLQRIQLYEYEYNFFQGLLNIDTSTVGAEACDTRGIPRTDAS